METNTTTGQMPTAYDYRRYDRIWQRVSPDLDPYPDIRAAGSGAETSPPAAAPVSAAAGSNITAVPAAVLSAAESPAVGSGAAGGSEDTLPGAEMNPCCMGTEAQESLDVLAGFIEEELAERRCCLSLSCRFRNQRAARLMRRFASEKQAAARELGTAYYLITGSCHAPAVTVEHMQWAGMAEALRHCYHQEACNGFNYRRAADETVDPCLQKLLGRLAEQSYQRAGDVMALLGQIIC